MRGPRLPDPALTDDELRRIVAEYVPETARLVESTLGIKLQPSSKQGIGTIRRSPGGGIVLGVRSGHHKAGAPTLPCYWLDDEFYSVMEWAAHHLARRIRIQRRSGRTRADLARRFGLGDNAVSAAISNPRGAVPFIISDIRAWTQPDGTPVPSGRSLERQVARWRLFHPPRLSRQDEHRMLEGFAREFLDGRRRKARSGPKSLAPTSS